jgi:hypothetical protein
LTQRGSIVDMIPFEHGDGVEVIGEHPCRHRARHAPADDDCLLTDVMRHADSSLDGIPSHHAHTRLYAIAVMHQPT